MGHTVKNPIDFDKNTTVGRYHYIHCNSIIRKRKFGTIMQIVVVQNTVI